MKSYNPSAERLTNGNNMNIKNYSQINFGTNTGIKHIYKSLAKEKSQPDLI